MFGKHYSLALTVVCAAVSLVLATVPASADRYGGYRGGDRGGGDRGGWSGYRGGWYGGDRGGWNGGYWGGGRYWGGSGYGGGYYPGYYDNYYSAPAVDYTPSYYYTPPTTVVVTPDTTAPDTRARVEVRVPAPDAQVFFDGAATQQQGTDRMFSSPPLNPGQTYTYNIEARWMENGRMNDMTKSVSVTPGETAVVDFGR